MMAGIGGQNRGFPAAIRGPNVPSSEGGISFAIYLDLQENRGQPMGIQNAPFLANRGRGRPEFRAN